MENNTPRAATQSQWEDLPKRIQAQQHKPVATITYSYNDFQNVWSNLNTSNYSSGYISESAFMQNFPWELSVDFNDLKNYLNIVSYDGTPSSQQLSGIPLTFQLQSYYDYDGTREYGEPQFGNGSIAFYNYPSIDDVEITVQPFGHSEGISGSDKSTQESEFVFMRANNISNLFSLTMNSTSYQLTTFPINFTATPDFTNGVVAFSNTYNIAPFDLNIGASNVTWRDLCEQVIQGVFPTIRLAGNWSSSTNTDTVQILEGRVLNRSRAGQGGGAIDLTTLISFSPEGVNNMPNTYNMDCLATLRLHQNYALETISTKMVGSGGGDNDGKYYFGTCETAAATRAKVVECDGFTLEEGATISVYFTNAQTYNGYPQLNVNGTGNIAVVYKGGSAGIRYMWSAGEIIDFTYHNEYWVCHGRALASTTYYGITKLSNSAISTSTSLALTPAVVNALAENMITGYDAYSASATYAVGDRVRYSSYAYECNTAITTPEAWTAAHWTALDPLQTQIDGKQDVLTAGTGISINNNVISATGGGGASTLTIAVTYDQQEDDAFTWSGATISEIESAYNSGTEIYIPTRYMGTVKVTSLSGDSQEVYMTALYTGYQTCTFHLKSDGTGEVYWYELAQEQTLQDVDDTLRGLISNKQDKLTAGNNITISNGTISATDTTYTAGTGISITNGVISCTFANGNGVSY